MQQRTLSRESQGEASVFAQAMRSRALLILLPAVLVLSLIGGALYASGWLPAQFVPRKIVVRGCSMTSSTEILGLLEFSGSESALALMARARGLAAEEQRWLQAVSVSPRLYRECIVDVSERRPLLRVVQLEQEYWLCDDGQLVSRNDQYDTGPIFEAAKSQPLVVIHCGPDSDHYPDSASVLVAASCCQQSLPGAIRKIEIGSDGRYAVYDSRNFRVLLGDGAALPEKIGALPKALRLCEDKRDKLLYLDASNPQRFYMKWREPQV